MSNRKVHPEAACLVDMYAALKIECSGVRNRKNSVYKTIKARFGFSGNKSEVLERFGRVLVMAGVLKTQ